MFFTFIGPIANHIQYNNLDLVVLGYFTQYTLKILNYISKL